MVRLESFVLSEFDLTLETILLRKPLLWVSDVLEDDMSSRLVAALGSCERLDWVSGASPVAEVFLFPFISSGIGFTLGSMILAMLLL